MGTSPTAGTTAATSTADISGPLPRGRPKRPAVTRRDFLTVGRQRSLAVLIRSVIVSVQALDDRRVVDDGVCTSAAVACRVRRDGSRDWGDHDESESRERGGPDCRSHGGRSRIIIVESGGARPGGFKSTPAPGQV